LVSYLLIVYFELMDALIIEDSGSFSLLLKQKLKTKGIQDVTIVESVEKGSWHLNENKPRLVFIDNGLPGVNGIDAFNILKELNPESFFVFMSSNLETLSCDQLASIDDKDIIIDKESLINSFGDVLDRYKFNEKKDTSLVDKIKSFFVESTK